MKKLFLLVALAFATTSVNAQSDFAINENGILTTYKGTGGDVVIPDGVIKIEDGVFVMNKNITSVYIPASVTKIGEFAFYKCDNLTNLIFATSSNLQIIDNFAFSESGIVSVKIPALVTKIGISTFRDCPNLVEVTFAENSRLKTIDKYAFLGIGISSIEIPASVIEIGEAAIYSCKNLTNVSFVKNSNLKTIDKKAFGLSSSIGSVEIPISVTKIEQYAFAACHDLTDITVRWKNPTTLIYGDDIFVDVNTSDIILCVPVGTAGLYSIEPWSNFNIIEFPSVTPSANNVQIQWQPIENAEGYRLIIYSDEAHTDIIYTLEFDAESKLIPALQGTRSRMQTTNTNFSHTVENLQISTDYYYTLEVLGVDNVVLASLSDTFTTTSTPINTVETRHATSAQKIAGYYSTLGAKLPKEPTSGMYIILYNNGKAEKIIAP